MRIKLFGSFAHFAKALHPLHGPQTWPWWRLIAFGAANLHPALPSTGYRLWIYTRWGACHFDVFLDRRPRPLC